MKTDCENTVVVRVDKSVFSLDKDVLLIASYVAPENSPLYDTLELKDGILILEESTLQIVQNEDPYILLCGDLNARTGCEQPKLEKKKSLIIRLALMIMMMVIVGTDAQRPIILWIILENPYWIYALCWIVLLWMSCVTAMPMESLPTCRRTTVASLTDNFIISEDLFSIHCELRIGDRVDLWHLPVEFKWKQADRMIDQPYQRESYESCTVWSEDCLPSYKQELESDSVKRCMQDAHLALGSDVDDFIEIFLNALYGAAACMVKKRGKRRSTWTTGLMMSVHKRKIQLKEHLK